MPDLIGMGSNTMIPPAEELILLHDYVGIHNLVTCPHTCPLIDFLVHIPGPPKEGGLGQGFATSIEKAKIHNYLKCKF